MELVIISMEAVEQEIFKILQILQNLKQIKRLRKYQQVMEFH